MDPDIKVDKDYRDSVFAKLKLSPENQTCFECGNRNPSWCSVNLGIFLCYNCTTHHRQMGSHLSFVRSSDYDLWSLRQLCFMENAGNKKAKEFFRSHGVQGAVDFSSQIAGRWRTELFETVSQIYPKKNSEDFSPLPKEEPTESEPKPEVKSEETQPEVPKTEDPPLPVKPQTYRFKQSAPLDTSKTHSFRKTKTNESKPSGFMFKPVSFKPPSEEEYFEPQPLKPPEKPKTIVLEPKPAHIASRKTTEKKAISSEDFNNSKEDDTFRKMRMQQLSGEKAISSDMYFGREQSKPELDADYFKEEAARYAHIAAEKAEKIKDKAVNFWSKFQQRFS